MDINFDRLCGNFIKWLSNTSEYLCPECNCCVKEYWFKKECDCATGKFTNNDMWVDIERVPMKKECNKYNIIFSD